MKSRRLISMLLSATLVMPMFSGSVSAATGKVAINAKNFPDANFRSYVSTNCDSNSDNYLSASEISVVKIMYVDGSSISDLTGIKYFTSLSELDCDRNNLTSLDVSNNTSLNILKCGYNNLTNLNVSHNSALKKLYCYNNNLTSLNVSNNTALTDLECGNNNLTSLDVSNNAVLETLNCINNNLTSLDVSCNTILKFFDCHNNNLPSLDLSNNIVLRNLSCDYNNISSLDVSNNQNLCYVSCAYNNFSSIDFSNNSYIVDLMNSCEPETCESWLDFPEGNPCIVWEKDGCALNRVVIDPYMEITANGSTLYGYTTPSSDSTGMTAFAERLYTEALGRSYDESGRDYWVSQLRSGMSGADAARQFFFSAEFTNANYSDDVYVTRLYRTFMGRTPDEGGKSYWVSQLTSGAMTREDVFNGFINSTEWANLCLQSGIISGGTQAPTISVEPSEEVTAFATRLYTTCLGRAADSAGVSWWATELANMRRTGTTAAKGFFFSDEYVSANHSDAEFVTALYRTFMGRECDQAGYDYWMGELASGCTRENVLERFAGCDEFGNICADAGIIR